MFKTKSCVSLLVCLVAACALSQSAKADTLVWGFDASYSNPQLVEVNANTGAIVTNFTAPNPTAAAGNGRAIAVVGTTIYYGIAGSGDVFVTNSITHADGGVLFNTGLGGIATIAWDGSHLWVSAYDGSNNAYEYSLSGTKLATVPGFGNLRDGFEVANNTIIANRGDGVGPYDVYNLSGTLITSDFLNTSGISGITTGVTFDGTDYWVSNPDGYSGGATQNLLEYNLSGTLIHTTLLGPPGPQASVGWLLEDLSSLGNVPNNPPPSTTPEPASLWLLGSGLLGLLVAYRRKLQSA